MKWCGEVKGEIGAGGGRGEVNGQRRGRGGLKGGKNSGWTVKVIKEVGEARPQLACVAIILETGE